MLDKLKEAMKNPPPERLAAIEFRSHFLNIIGVFLVSIILVVKGFWYIIFALIFTTGVSYSQGMSAYARYQTIKSIIGDKPIEEEKSPTRYRSRIVTEVFGKTAKWLSATISVVLAIMILPPFGVKWYVQIGFVLLIFYIWGILYFFIFYWIASQIKRRNDKVKGGKNKHGKEKENKRRRRND